MDALAVRLHHLLIATIYVHSDFINGTVYPIRLQLI